MLEKLKTDPTEEVRAHIERALADIASGVISPPKPDADFPYSRTVVHRDDKIEVMVARWRASTWCAPHDHGGRIGWVHVARGKIDESRFGKGDAEASAIRTLEPGDSLICGGEEVHALRGHDDAITVHVYAGQEADFRVFSETLEKMWRVPATHGAWQPRESSDTKRKLIWISYTTKYRGGSKEFARAAQTLAIAKRAEFPGVDVVVAPLETKRDFTSAFEKIESDGRAIEELHFIGHSGMYGIMFGSTKWPEQLSPHEWQSLAIPFSKNARAYFHACRTARWFAGFFANLYGVETFGHHGYTTMSKSADRFSRVRKKSDPVFVVSCPGRKTHGLSGSVRKYVFAARTFPMTPFTKGQAHARAGYDAVAPLYAAAFEDIRLRAAEWRWLNAQFDALPASPRVLDIGCGTGSLLRALAPRIGASVGVDVSRGMIDEAKSASKHGSLAFETIDGPTLPFADASFDVVISFLSFRYLDWDPIVREIARVLTPAGRLIVIDMVEKPWDVRSAPMLLRGLARTAKNRLTEAPQHRALRKMVARPEWKEMVATNPIRAEHEYRWYLESRFPGARLETLDVTLTKRTVAFASGPMHDAHLTPLAFP